MVFSCWPLHLNSALQTELWIFSWSLLMSISQKVQYGKVSCSDIILQHLMELYQEVSQVLTAERLELETWVLAPFGSEGKCTCFTAGGSTHVVCIPLFGFLQSVQPLCCSSANRVCTVSVSVHSTVLDMFPVSHPPFAAPFLSHAA